MKNLEQKGDYRLMQILNLAGFVLVVVINFLANYLPIWIQGKFPTCIPTCLLLLALLLPSGV